MLEHAFPVGAAARSRTVFLRALHLGVLIGRNSMVRSKGFIPSLTGVRTANTQRRTKMPKPLRNGRASAVLR
jgi:hypothetical protein